jgi:hypothetical protein
MLGDDLESVRELEEIIPRMDLSVSIFHCRDCCADVGLLFAVDAYVAPHEALLREGSYLSRTHPLDSTSRGQLSQRESQLGKQKSSVRYRVVAQ